MSDGQRLGLLALYDYLDEHGLRLVSLRWDEEKREFVAIVREKNG